MLTPEFFEHLPPGKPYGCIIVSPLDAPDDWDAQYEIWQFDKTGDVPPPPGYEDWDMEAALEDLQREQQRILSTKTTDQSGITRRAGSSRYT